MQQQPDAYTQQFNNIQTIIMTLRRVQLAFGCLALLFIIVSIIRKKLYVYNTTKLFMWCCIFYFIGMFVVCFHNDYLSGGYQFAYTQQTRPDLTKSQHYILKILQKMKQDGSLYWCGLQGFINLYAYDFGYFFAVLVSYNVFCVINGNYRNFMKNVFTNVKVIIFLLLMLIAYFIPYLFILITDDYQNSYIYSYGPMGFQYTITVQNQLPRTATLLFFGGFLSKPGERLYSILQLVNIYLCPILMFFIHLILLALNRNKINKFHQQDYLNSKQQFLLKSGSLGMIVFSIQALHLTKFMLVLIFKAINQGSNTQDPTWWCIFILVLNFLFDFYPLFLLYFYFRYTKQKTGTLRNSSTILEEENDD